MTTFNKILHSLCTCPATKGYWKLKVMGAYPNANSDVLRINLFGKEENGEKPFKGYIDENGDAMWLTSTLPMKRVLERFLEEIKEEE